MLSRRVAQEVQVKHVVKVLQRHFFKIKSIVQLRKLKNHINNFGLVARVQTPVLCPVENTLAALVNQVGADRIQNFVLAAIPILLLGQQNHGYPIFGFSFVKVHNSIPDVLPNVGCVVSVQINNSLVKVGRPWPVSSNSLTAQVAWLDVFSVKLGVR